MTSLSNSEHFLASSFYLPTFCPAYFRLFFFFLFFNSMFFPPTSYNVHSNPMRIRCLCRIPQHLRPHTAQWTGLREVYMPPPAQALFRISHTVMMTLFPIGRKSTRTLPVGARGSYVFPPSPHHPLDESGFRRSWAPLLASSLLSQLLWVWALVYRITAKETAAPRVTPASPVRVPIPRGLPHRRTRMIPVHSSRILG